MKGEINRQIPGNGLIIPKQSKVLTAKPISFLGGLQFPFLFVDGDIWLYEQWML